MNLFNFFAKKVNFFLILIILLSTVLRILWLDRYPPSLYTDEANQGYNAYSLLKTGSDEHGSFLPVALRSFGDWKPPIPTYLMIPFISIWSLNEITVRLPSAILSVATVLISFYLVKQLFERKSEASKIALLTSFFLSISPWHILQGRSAMLVTIALFFLETGILLFLMALKRPKFFIMSSLFFALSIYSYYGLRVITPLVILTLVIIYRRHFSFISRYIGMSILLAALILLPLGLSFLKEKDVVLGRAKTVSVFYDQGVKLRQWELLTQDGNNNNPLISRFFHNNLYMYGKSIFQRFLSHFDGHYLFLEGDKAQPFQIPIMGILYLMDAVFIVLGIYLLYKNYSGIKLLITLLLIISFIPAAFTFMTPSSNRTFNAIVPFVILIALGIFKVIDAFKNKYPVAIIITLLYIFGFSLFLRQFFIVLPKDFANFWNYGWKEVVNYTASVENKYDNIIVADVNGMPYIYFLFYELYNPANYQKEAIRTYVADRFGFEHVEGFGKYLFPNNFHWKYVKDNLQKSTLYVVPADQAKEEGGFTEEIKFPNGKTAYKIFEYE